jgi:hypothetical protein
MLPLTHFLKIFLLLLLLTACMNSQPTENISANSCPVTEPVWIKPPKDSAIPDAPAFGYYFANEDRSILASAWWMGREDYQLHVTEEGIKLGWFRPAGAPLRITGQRLDEKAPPLQADIPGMYPTQFQATGISFPTEGCWEITAEAEESALTFVIWVGP